MFTAIELDAGITRALAMVDRHGNEVYVPDPIENSRTFELFAKWPPLAFDCGRIMRADLRQDDFLIVFDPDECPAATEEQRQQLLASLDRVVACFESLIEALTDDVESTNRTLSFLDEAYEASAKYRAA